VGCSEISTSARLAPGTPVTSYRTYSWFQDPNKPVQTLAEQRMRSSLEAKLASKGLMPATAAPPDFLVAYHAKTQEKIQVTPSYAYGYPYTWGYSWGGFPDVTSYLEGTLIVDFIDPHSNQVFWRGTAEGEVQHPENPDPQRIDKAISRLIDQYPAPQMASSPRQTL
jgi:hypothetical protein